MFPIASTTPLWSPHAVKSGFAELHCALKGYQEVLGKLHDLDRQLFP